MTVPPQVGTAAPAGAPASPRPAGRRVSWLVVALTSLAIVGYVVATYARGSLETLAEQEAGLATTYAGRPALVQVAFYAHIVFSAVALGIGPLQFVRALRRRRPRVHRWVGRAYLVCVLVGAAASLVMAFVNSAALNGFFGFGALAVLWGWTAWRGWGAARAGDFRGHQAWMIRSFALTYAGVTLRVWFGALIGVQLLLGGSADPDAVIDTAYAALPFLSWLPNLVVAELLLRRRGLPALGVVDRRPARAGR
ncbi:DUF2306 domain-containing protein [Pseudonocardia lacus]|uniref:DUF2306 domain-containing protein n=1 Tax=Pseudonocardia lacus TaxID=2835865 RepID=UPI001BDD8AA9|nr:DUF2306 domain-containing protein [Pseudonocardia lacus]